MKKLNWHPFFFRLTVVISLIIGLIVFLTYTVKIQVWIHSCRESFLVELLKEVIMFKQLLKKWIDDSDTPTDAWMALTFAEIDTLAKVNPHNACVQLPKIIAS